MLREYLPYVGEKTARERWKKLINKLQKKASPVIVLWLLVAEIIKSVALWKLVSVLKLLVASAVFVCFYIYWNELREVGEEAKEKVEETKEKATEK